MSQYTQRWRKKSIQSAIATVGPDLECPNDLQESFEWLPDRIQFVKILREPAFQQAHD
jgi:hypothetical protein